MERDNLFSVERNSEVLQIEAINVAPNGLGFGEGTISIESLRDELGQETMKKVDELINSPEILTPVSQDKDGNQLDDDGCGDGREVSQVYEGAITRSKSLTRSKVFGGGVTMATAALIGLGKAQGLGIREAFSQGQATLRDKMIGFGGHTDRHNKEDPNNCGCGAIDKAPTIVRNAVKFAPQIRASIEALGIDTTGLDEVESAYVEFAAGEMGEYTGRSVIKEITNDGKVVKELDDDHKEVVAVLNLVEGFTVDQEKVRTATGGTAQSFAVDVWRAKDIAERLYKDEPEETRHKAFLSELVYTLATAGTLTAGDLPIYVVSQQPELVAA